MNTTVFVPESAYLVLRGINIPFPEGSIQMLEWIFNKAGITITPDSTRFLASRDKLVGFGGRQSKRLIEISCEGFDRIHRIASEQNIDVLRELLDATLGPLGLPIFFAPNERLCERMQNTATKGENVFFQIDDAAPLKNIRISLVDASGVEMTTPVPKLIASSNTGMVDGSLLLPLTYVGVKVTAKIEQTVVAVNEFGVDKPKIAMLHSETHNITVI